jgi:glutamine amidotransferase
MVQGTFGVSDGSSLWAVRYATEGRARSLFVSADVDSLHRLYPERKMWFATATSDDRLIASEPFSDLPGVWHEIDESSAAIVRSGGVLEHEPFRPHQVPPAILSSP